MSRGYPRNLELAEWLEFRAHVNEQAAPPITEEQWREIRYVYPRVFRECAAALRATANTGESR